MSSPFDLDKQVLERRADIGGRSRGRQAHNLRRPQIATGSSVGAQHDTFATLDQLKQPGTDHAHCHGRDELRTHRKRRGDWRVVHAPQDLEFSALDLAVSEYIEDWLRQRTWRSNNGRSFERIVGWRLHERCHNPSLDVGDIDVTNRNDCHQLWPIPALIKGTKLNLGHRFDDVSLSNRSPSEVVGSCEQDVADLGPDTTRQRFDGPPVFLANHPSFFDNRVGFNGRSRRPLEQHVEPKLHCFG